MDDEASAHPRERRGVVLEPVPRASSGTRARPPGTRSPSRRSATTATAMRSSFACGRTARPVTPARVRVSPPGSGGGSRSGRGSDPAGSYVVPSPTIRSWPRKVGEEGVEVALAGASESDERLVDELADLWFHSYASPRSARPRPRRGRGPSLPGGRRRPCAGPSSRPCASPPAGPDEVAASTGSVGLLDGFLDSVPVGTRGAPGGMWGHPGPWRLSHVRSAPWRSTGIGGGSSSTTCASTSAARSGAPVLRGPLLGVLGIPPDLAERRGARFANLVVIEDEPGGVRFTPCLRRRVT